MFFEVVDANLNKDVKLESIPSTFDILVYGNMKSYELGGIVDYKRPFKLRKTAMIVESNATNSIVHYTAICPRSGNKWSEFDDISATTQNKYGYSLCCPVSIFTNLL